MEANLSTAKQPAPSVSEPKSEKIKQTRKYNRPQVGVVGVPNISKTPIEDTLVLKKKENPQIKYKFIATRGVLDKFSAFLTVSTVLTGLLAILGLKKK